MRSVVLVAFLAGCGVRVSSGTDPIGVDADLRSGHDASPADVSPDAAPPCIEGDHRMQTATGCFASFTTVAVTRAEARTACASHGMHLAYVKSAADEAIIAALANGVDLAIGLDDIATEGTFVWEDGTPLTYTDWHAGEPNNGNGMYEEDCAIYAGARIGGQWDDRPCTPPPLNSGAYGYVCQR